MLVKLTVAPAPRASPALTSVARPPPVLTDCTTFVVAAVRVVVPTVSVLPAVLPMSCRS